MSSLPDIHPTPGAVARRSTPNKSTPNQSTADQVTTRHGNGGRVAECDVQRRAWAEKVDRALGQLPPAQAYAVRLTYFEQLSQRQAATRLRISADSLKRDLAAALQSLPGLLDRGARARP